MILQEISIIVQDIHTLQKQMGNSNPFFGVKILATQITLSLSWNDSGIVVVEYPQYFTVNLTTSYSYFNHKNKQLNYQSSDWSQ